MEPNTPQLWNRVWQAPPSDAEHVYNLALEEHTIRCKRIQERVVREFGGIAGRRVVEIGAGAGTNAGIMAKRGAQVTVLDYAPLALERARELFAANGVEGEFVQANALALPDALRGKFDVSMSFGLNEHFTGAERVEIFRAHLDVLRPGGISFVSVPNALNPPYRGFKWLAETTKRWKLGVEIPFRREELDAICAELGVKEHDSFGDSFVTSWQFVNPWRYIGKRVGRKKSFDVTQLRQERGSALDERWSYATVLVMKK